MNDWEFCQIFQSTSSIQRKTEKEEAEAFEKQFQSTSSIQRKTRKQISNLFQEAISIHFLYTEEDGSKLTW